MLLFLYGSHPLKVVRSEWLPLVVATLLIVGGLLSEYLLYSVSVLFFCLLWPWFQSCMPVFLISFVYHATPILMCNEVATARVLALSVLSPTTPSKANVNGIHVSGQDFPSLAGGRAVVIIHYAIIPFV